MSASGGRGGRGCRRGRLRTSGPRHGIGGCGFQPRGRCSGRVAGRAEPPAHLVRRQPGALGPEGVVVTTRLRGDRLLRRRCRPLALAPTGDGEPGWALDQALVGARSGRPAASVAAEARVSYLTGDRHQAGLSGPNATVGLPTATELTLGQGLARRGRGVVGARGTDRSHLPPGAGSGSLGGRGRLEGGRRRHAHRRRPAGGHHAGPDLRGGRPQGVPGGGFDLRVPVDVAFELRGPKAPASAWTPTTPPARW